MQVEYWDEKEKYAALNMEECEARNGARESYKSWVMKEEIFWRQKSRELWLKEGDNNTRFFHRMTNAHSRRNWLSKLKCRRAVLMGLDNSEAEGLENPFSEEEVLAALADLGKDKAPRLDGFTMAFVKSLNATFLVLVPKKGGAEDLKDFRPISLVGSLYKLLAKVLSNRIKKAMGEVILEPKNAFVEGRQILDAVLIANGVVDSRLKRNQGGWRVRGRGGEGILISHLLFADDTLVFWLRVNLEKSELIPVGRVNDIVDLALELGCKVGGLPSSYLGLPLGAPFKSEAVWDSVEERFRKRKVRLRLEKIQRDFLWGGDALEQRPHLVRWNLVCLERKKGGLGVRNLALMNKALLDKWK
ncbi:hypothetical protein CK203_086136 [Vitis vinifera]|uniref:Uncharacterized protein n=1 Tax=Vitis vinifera TaxID=29760 RepID=A0A438CTB2_VITVI|nr:hypothetical protein CK203_086136 [Vitis vinifera]